MSRGIRIGLCTSILVAAGCAFVWGPSFHDRTEPPPLARPQISSIPAVSGQSTDAESATDPGAVPASPPLDSTEEQLPAEDDRPPITTAQKVALFRSVYGELLAQLNLDDSQAVRFVLLAAAAREARLNRALGIESAHAEDPRSISDAILSLLGYERFQQYESFESTLESRSELRNFESELRASGLSSLNEAHRNDLLSILTEERALMPQVAIVSPDRCSPEQCEALARYYDRIEQRAEFKLPSQQYSVFALRVDRDRQALSSHHHGNDTP